jgi:hypothetical protein
MRRWKFREDGEKLLCPKMEFLRLPENCFDKAGKCIKVLQLLLDNIVDFLLGDFAVEMDHTVSVTSHFGQLTLGKIWGNHLIFLEEPGDISVGRRPGSRYSGENMGANVHDGFQRSMKIIKSDTKMIGVGMEFCKGNPFESL